MTFFESIAIPLARRGWKVIPLEPKLKSINTKFVRRSVEESSTDPDQIHDWGELEPDGNVGVFALQAEGGLCILDKDDGRDIREAYERDTGNKFPRTFFVTSSPGRGHWYFLQTAKTLARRDNITEDHTNHWFSFRVKNEYVCSIGSIHPKTGNPYTITEDVPLAPMPDELLDWLQKQVVVKPKKKTKRKEGQKIPKGERYPALISETGRLWQNGGFSRELTVATMLAWAKENFEMPAEDGSFDARMIRSEVEHLVDSYQQGERKKVDDDDIVPHMPITETSNAERLVTKHAKDIRYCSDRKTWCAWDGHVWNVGDTGGVMRRVKEISREIYGEAEQTKNKKLREALGAWSMQSESRRTQENSMALARWFPAVEVHTFSEVFDTHLEMLNAQNCTINLRTGETHSHKREDFLTKRVPINYNRSAKCPKFMQFLNESLPWPGMLGYLSRLAGYCLTGLTVEQAWYMFYGLTATGKSTLVKVLRGILGPYSISLPDNYFLITRTGTDYATADLAGVRLATCSETNEGKFLDVAKIKSLTGKSRSERKKSIRTFSSSIFKPSSY